MQMCASCQYSVLVCHQKQVYNNRPNCIKQPVHVHMAIAFELPVMLQQAAAVPHKVWHLLSFCQTFSMLIVPDRVSRHSSSLPERLLHSHFCSVTHHHMHSVGCQRAAACIDCHSLTACAELYAAFSLHHAPSLDLTLAGPADFAASSSGMAPLPLSLPFAPEPLPSQDQAVGDIPFPVLRYEEELVAGLILLQHEAGAVNSVDQLLTLQPQCAMPNELARHFHGNS